MDDIVLKHVTYRYPLARQDALKDFSYRFKKGVFYGIIGENGGGKTTLCNLVRGLIPHFYKGDLTGECLIAGQDIREIDIDRLSTRIGYIFQNPFTQISGVKETVFEEIAMGLENLGVPKKEMIERVIDVVKLLKIENLIKNNPNRLSGGQRQRVAFASIMAMDSEILVIDEPTSQLDPESTEDVFAIIHGLKEKGKTILLVEHKVDLLAEYAEEVLVMKDGRLITSGTAKSVLADPDLLAQGATLPQVALLGRDLAECKMGLREIPITRRQCVDYIQEKMR